MSKCKYIWIALFAAVFFVTPVMAAEIPVVYEKLAGNKRSILWETITQSDTVEEAYWFGGKGYVEVTGTPADAVLTFDYGLVSGSLATVDTDATPDGFTFTNTTGGTLFEFPAGYVDITFTSGGGVSQDLDIRVVPIK